MEQLVLQDSGPIKTKYWRVLKYSYGLMPFSGTEEPMGLERSKKKNLGLLAGLGGIGSGGGAHDQCV